MAEQTSLNNARARFCTLGCKLNFSETATFAQQLRSRGVVEAKEGEAADIVVVNTCAVTEVAAAKCRQAIKRLIRENAGAFIVVTGCYAQLELQVVASMRGVSLVVGNNEKARLADIVAEHLTHGAGEGPAALCSTAATKDITSFAPSCSRGNRTRYFLKVQDGCSYYCTYCAIPFARGRSRNPSIASLVAQAQAAAREGGREIVLTGVNIGDFGRSTGERFIDLVRALDAVEGIDRFRISSIEPDLLDDEVIAFCANESRKFMPHFHIPLQSGSDEVLRLMHRRYDTTLFADKVRLIKTLLPEAFIGVDVMVGCRGETEALFDECYSFVESLDVAKLHVFPYSERKNTAALRIEPAVAEREKRHRTERLLALSEVKQRAFYASFVGSERQVLFERASQGRAMHGFTDNYIRVELPAEQAREELDNEIKMVKLLQLTPKGNVVCTLVP